MSSSAAEVRARRVVIVDDLPSPREGLRLVLLKQFLDLEVECMDFDEAALLDDWSQVDYVIVDLSEPAEHDQADEFPGVQTVRHIRSSRAAGRGPWTVVITGETAAFHEPLVMRRLAEAQADYFIMRKDLEHQMAEVFEGIQPATSLDRFRTRNEDVLTLGVNRKTRLEWVLEAVRNTDLLRRQGGGGVMHGLREFLSKSTHLGGVDKDGNPTTKNPRNWQIEKVVKRATRIPRGHSD